MASEGKGLKDRNQRKAVTSDLDKNIIVEAAAGTGKTTSLLNRMVALIETGRCTVETLAAVTFTRKAAAELRSRFGLALEGRVKGATGQALARLDNAVSNTERCFIGTIHSFCARLLRERPVEAGVDPGFGELSEEESASFKSLAWEEFCSLLYAEGDPVLEELDRLGLSIGQIENAYIEMADNVDIENWPTGDTVLSDHTTASSRLLEYADHMRSLKLPPPPRSSRDNLIPVYRSIPESLDTLGVEIEDPVRLMDLLSRFRSYERSGIVQKHWPGETRAQRSELAIGELERWNRFTVEVVQPALTAWMEYRYSTVISVASVALSRFRALKEKAGSLDFQDLLLKSALLLRENPEVRTFFQNRFTHLLIDEFQDTDPVQAEVMLLLTASDPRERNWRKCKPLPGSLFVVGDPKQSIYRFRRADITTYNDVKDIMEGSGGICLTLSTNFRSTRENIDWVNSFFTDCFPASASDTSPSYVPLHPRSNDGSESSTSGTSVIRLPESCSTKHECILYEADFIARYIRRAIDEGQGVLRPDGRSLPAAAGDFIIITRNTIHLSSYASALQDLHIPHEVTGGSILNEVPELHLLFACLLAAARPYSSSAVAGVLRSGLFGISDDTLYTFKRAGGQFTAPFSVPNGLENEESDLLEDAFSRLNKYSRWLDTLPPVSAADMMIEDLGLLASAALHPGGNTLAGSIGKAVELFRLSRDELFTKDDLIDCLGHIVSKEENYDGVTALPPDPDVVRLMNLHKVKGLEAPIVFLADTTGKREFPVLRHIDRKEGKTSAYLAVRETRKMWGGGKIIAQAPGWDSKWEPMERAFLEDEEIRLLYVAATRAGSRLIISQRSDGKDKSYWSPFDGHLQDVPVLEDPGPAFPPARKVITIRGSEVTKASESIDSQWKASSEPTSIKITASNIGTGQDTGSTPPAGEHGTEWGTVIHLLLESAMSDPDADLNSLAVVALRDNGLESELAERAIESVKAVIASPVWSRAATSEHKLMEVPFSLSREQDVDDGKKISTLLTGVIDLAFKEPDGWVIVDYKTGGKRAEEVKKLAQHYRSQIELYSESWEYITGFSVKEKGFYFVDLGLYVTVD